jgi:chaperone modulatory protein CbpM
MMNKQEFLTSAGLEMQTLDLWLEQRWLIPDQTFGGINFTDVDLARARLILDLKTGFSINDEGIDVILHLMDQLHGLRRALDQLRKDL